MSAGASSPQADNDLGKLAPKFRDSVVAALADCHAAGLDAFVYEAHRSNELQALYYQRGRTIKPPATPVTNAPTAEYSWHYFSLAVDVISKAHEWDAPFSWFKSVADIFTKYVCAWGGLWHSPDLPHFQWAHCVPSPSDHARELLRTGGLEAVWKAVGAV